MQYFFADSGNNIESEHILACISWKQCHPRFGISALNMNEAFSMCSFIPVLTVFWK